MRFCGIAQSVRIFTIGVVGMLIALGAPAIAQAGPANGDDEAVLTLSPATDTNTVGQEHCVTATLTEEDNKPVRNIKISFSVSGANTASGTITTNNQGKATFCYTGTKAGSDTITAVADIDKDNKFESDEPTATATKIYVPAAPSTMTLTPPTATNPAGQEHCVTATVRDAFGNPTPSVNVVFSVSGANPQPKTIKVTNASGQATFCYTGTKPGSDTITAFADTNKNGVQDAGEPTATATKTYTAAAPATITLQPPTATNTAGQQHCVTATVKDRFGNPTPGVVVTFSVSGANPTTGAATTDASGQARFCYVGTKAGTDTITAFVDTNANGMADTGEPSAQATKTYIPGAPKTLVLTEPVAQNPAATEHCVTATVRDEFGNPTPGIVVRFSVVGANAASGSVTTDANGQAKFCYTGTKVGVDTITAFADTNNNGQQDLLPISGGPEPSATAIKTYVPGAPATVTLEPATDTNAVGDPHCVTATVKDIAGNPTPNISVVFSVSGANTAGGSATTNANGQATFCYTGTKTGTDTITAFADTNKSGMQELGEPSGAATKIYEAGPPASVTLAPPTATNTVGEQHCVTATVKDRFGNPVPGAAVTFSVSGANTAAGAGFTDNKGEARFCYTGTKAGTDTITASVTGTELKATATKTYKPGPPAAISLDPLTATNNAGEQHCVTATVTDRFGNPTPNIAVVFSVSGANPQPATKVTTDANGQAKFCYTGTKAGGDVITAFADTNGNGQADAGEPTGTATKTYKPGPPASVTLAPPTADNVAGEEHCVTATVTDRFDNPVPGAAVTFSVSGANTAAGAGVTDANGQARFCYTGTKAGTDTITATVVGTELKATATKTYKPGPPAKVDVAPATATNTVGQQHCVTATVTDKFGNPVGAGVTVFFTVTGANPQAQTAETTNAESKATFCYTGTNAGKDVITAVVDANANGQADTGEPTGVATKTYTPGPPAKLELSPKAATNTVGEEHCVTATVTDEFGNPVPGVTVYFDVTGAVSAQGIVGASGFANTDGQGKAKFCYTSELPGENVIKAFADSNGNGQHDAGEPFDTATKTYVPPISSPLCEVKVTDGGWIFALNGDKSSFGGNAKTDDAGLVVSGSQEYTDHGPTTPVHVKSTKVLALVCDTPTSATIYGIANVSLASAPAVSSGFRIRVTDGGEPSTADTYGILVAGYWSGEPMPLKGGNIQIHREN